MMRSYVSGSNMKENEKYKTAAVEHDLRVRSTLLSLQRMKLFPNRHIASHLLRKDTCDSQSFVYLYTLLISIQDCLVLIIARNELIEC